MGNINFVSSSIDNIEKIDETNPQFDNWNNNVLQYLKCGLFIILFKGNYTIDQKSKLVRIFASFVEYSKTSEYKFDTTLIDSINKIIQKYQQSLI